MSSKFQWVIFWIIIIGIFIGIGYLGRNNYGNTHFWDKIPGTPGWYGNY